MAQFAIYDILSRGKVPVVVGGSTMWIDWLIHGKPDAPKSNELQQSKVNNLIDPLQEKGEWDEALKIASFYGSKTVQSLSRNDWYK